MNRTQTEELFGQFNRSLWIERNVNRDWLHHKRHHTSDSPPPFGEHYAVSSHRDASPSPAATMWGLSDAMLTQWSVWYWSLSVLFLELWLKASVVKEVPRYWCPFDTLTNKSRHHWSNPFSLKLLHHTSSPYHLITWSDSVHWCVATDWVLSDRTNAVQWRVLETIQR